MTTIFDVAKYILDKKNTTAYELQKLCYYVQAWSLAVEDKLMFQDRFEAWAHGPVCKALFNSHRGDYSVSPEVISKGDKDNIAPNDRDVIDAVLQKYNGMNGDDLEKQTHLELPWKYARRGYSDGAYCRRIIKADLMRDYYRTNREDYEWMNDAILMIRAKRRLEKSDETKTFSEAMDILGITAEDIECAENIEFEIE